MAMNWIEVITSVERRRRWSMADKARLVAAMNAPGDRRRLCRKRKVLIAERVEHVNRIEGLLFSQGISSYEPLRRDRRQRLEDLTTGDGRTLGARWIAL